MEILLSIVVLVPAILFILYVVLSIIYNKLRIARLAWLFAAAVPTPSSKPAADKSASPAGSPASPASAASAAAPEPSVKAEDEDGIEMQWAPPPQA